MTRWVESECGAVAVGRTYLLPPLSFGGALLVRTWLRFHTPLIEPDMQISRIRLSDKTSRLRPRRAACPATITIAGPATIMIAGEIAGHAQWWEGLKPRPKTGRGRRGFPLAPFSGACGRLAVPRVVLPLVSVPYRYERDARPSRHRYTGTALHEQTHPTHPGRRGGDVRHQRAHGA